MSELDRRQFVKKAGIGAAGAGALWVAPSVIGYNAAFAGASCLQKDTLNYTGQSGAPTSPLNFATVGSYPSIDVTTVLGTVGTPGAANAAGGNFVVTTFELGANTASKLVLDMNDNATGEGYTVTYTFTRHSNNAAYTVFNLAFSMFDIDSQANPGFIDNVFLTWVGTATMNTPTLGSYVQGSGSAGTPWQGNKGGDHNAAGNSANGNIGVSFTGGLSSLTIHYLSGTILGSEQYIGISNLTWCR